MSEQLCSHCNQQPRLEFPFILPLIWPVPNLVLWSIEYCSRRQPSLGNREQNNQPCPWDLQPRALRRIVLDNFHHSSLAQSRQKSSFTSVVWLIQYSQREDTRYAYAWNFHAPTRLEQRETWSQKQYVISRRQRKRAKHLHYWNQPISFDRRLQPIWITVQWR